MRPASADRTPSDIGDSVRTRCSRWEDTGYPPQMEYTQQDDNLRQVLGDSIATVAVSFLDDRPDGIDAIDDGAPASCSYWRLAVDQRRTFYTESKHHFGCPVGAHTHSVRLPGEVKAELEGLVNTMVGLKYLTPEDVQGLPTRESAMAFAVYAPLDLARFAPDLVLVRGNARQLMLLAEASQAAGVEGGTPTMGRPTCAVIPQAIQTAKTSASFGCIGNRVYTGTPDNEAYFAIPGQHLADVIAKLHIIANANRELEKFHQGRVGAAM